MSKAPFWGLCIYRGKMKTAVSVLIAVFLLISCATSHTLRPSGETLQDAVKAYWESRVKNDAKVSYVYENMSLDKRFDEGYYEQNYRKYQVQVFGFEILDIGKEGSGLKGTTPVKIKVKMKVLLDIGIKRDENRPVEVIDFWIKHEDGKWYHMIQHMTGQLI